MGKKGSWFSAIKRVFTHNSKEKPANGEKKGKGILRRGEAKSFNISLFREPSSIEKILSEADQLFIRPPTSPENRKIEPDQLPTSWGVVSSPKAASPEACSSRVLSPKSHSVRTVSPKAILPKAKSSPRNFRSSASSSKTAAPNVNQGGEEISYIWKPESILRNQHASATKIQAAYRSYRARRNFRALKGLVRLQGVVRGQHVKRQTMNAMKQMQLLVRVQTQIQSRRIQMLENQELQQRYRNKETESTLSKWTQLSEAGNSEAWDDSSLTREQVEARLQRKVEAVIKRDRAISYAYSHQLRRSNPRSAQNHLDSRSNGYTWWWNWLERQLPPTSSSQSQTAAKNLALTSPIMYKPSPQFHANNYNHKNFPFDNHNEVFTPFSSKSSIPIRGKQFQSRNRTPRKESNTRFVTYSMPRANAANAARDLPLKDDDSLMSCPPFSAPNYMMPTISAKAKVRAYSNPKERFPVTPGNDSQRRLSFPSTPNIGSFKGSNKDTTTQRVLEKREYPRSIGETSVDSAVSMPAIVGRKPFNRFV